MLLLGGEFEEEGRKERMEGLIFGGGELKVEESSRMDGWIAVLFCDFCRAQLLFFFLSSGCKSGGERSFLSCAMHFPGLFILLTRYTATRNHNSMDYGRIYLSNNYRVRRKRKKRKKRGISPLEVMGAFR
jgi:hypothetical protein